MALNSLEDVMSAGAGDACKSRGLGLADYNARGVIITGEVPLGKFLSDPNYIAKELVAKSHPNAIMITDVKPALLTIEGDKKVLYVVAATALVRR